MSDELLFAVADGVAQVTFNRPGQRNALTWAMYDGLVEAIRAVDADRSVRAVILRGAGGRAFAAGTDIGQFRAFRTAADAWAYEERIDSVLTVLEACRVPTIAVVEGACTGGGAAIAACCDLRLAANGARFGIPIARTLGNCLSLASLSRLSALIGAARLKEIVFTARLVDAEEALRIGLVSEVHPPEAIGARAAGLARTLAGHAPLTMQAIKTGLHRLRPAPGDDRDLIELCYGSDDFREGMDAFLAKRPPRFSGR